MIKKVISYFIIIVAIVVIGIMFFNRKDERNVVNVKNEKVEEITQKKETKGINVVPTMNDDITADSCWCGTFQLVWNDMKNEIVKKDIVFNPQLDMVKNLNREDFNEIYDNMNKETKKYTGSSSMKTKDEFKAPNLTFNEKKEYKELANKEFETANPVYKRAVIMQAIQSIKFSLDEKGGEIKSEAGIDMEATTGLRSITKEDEPRYFYVDDTFAIFLREKGKEKPYFAAKVNDVTKFQ